MADALKSGFPTITPHLVVKGAAEAIEFYKRAFGAVERHRMHMGESSDGAPKIGHAELQFGDSVVMLADDFPEYGCPAPGENGGSVVIHLMSPDVDATFARAVEAGATATMPPADMFWGDRYGKLVDPFGHHWSIATHIEDVSPEEMQKRMEAMSANAGEPCA